MHQFSVKTDNFEFFVPNLPKRKLGFQIQKTNVGIRISILEIPYVPIFRKMDNFKFLGPNLPKTEFWGRNFKNLRLDSESTFLRYFVYQFSDKTDSSEFLGPNLPKN